MQIAKCKMELHTILQYAFCTLHFAICNIELHAVVEAITAGMNDVHRVNS